MLTYHQWGSITFTQEKFTGFAQEFIRYITSCRTLKTKCCPDAKCAFTGGTQGLTVTFSGSCPIHIFYFHFPLHWRLKTDNLLSIQVVQRPNQRGFYKRTTFNVKPWHLELSFSHYDGIWSQPLTIDVENVIMLRTHLISSQHDDSFWWNAVDSCKLTN